VVLHTRDWLLNLSGDAMVLGHNSETVQ